MNLKPPPNFEPIAESTGGRVRPVWVNWFQSIVKFLTNPVNITIQGVTDGSSAAAGVVGEVITSNISSGSAVSLTDDTNANVTSITLTAGNWLIWGSGFLDGATGTTLFDARFSISTTSATLDSNNDRLQWYVQNTTIFGNSADVSVPLPACVVRITTSTTYYLVARGNFSTSTLAAYGYLTALRFM